MRLIKMSRGLIRLSYCQAESAPERGTLLCLLSVAALLLSGGTTFAAFRLKESGWLAASAAAGLTAAWLRAALQKGVFRAVRGFLRTGQEQSDVKKRVPDTLQWYGFSMAFLAFRAFVGAALQTPAICCLRIGAAHYALSGEEETYLLAVKAALCLTASGVIFTTLLFSRFGCAEYLCLSGRCSHPAEALETSWRLTRDGGGEWLVTAALSSLCGATVGNMARMNAAAAMIRHSTYATEGM